MEGEGYGEKLAGVGSEKIHWLCVVLTLRIDLLLFFAVRDGLFPGYVRLHFAAAFAGNDRYQRRDVETYVEVVFMQPAGLAYS
jgi:hypothetical protein